MKTHTQLLTLAALAFACQATAGESLFQVEPRALVSRADLIYLAPTEHNREGQPIGNGRMGTVVWTTPGAVHFLINRVDLYSADSSCSVAYSSPADDFGRLARVSIEVGGEPFAPAKDFLQRLSLYDAECIIRGQGVGVRCFISSERDVLALEIDDSRTAPPPLKVTVTAVRPLETRTGEHLARVEFPAVGKDIALLQRFDEKDYHCSVRWLHTSSMARRVWRRRNGSGPIHDRTWKSGQAAGLACQRRCVGARRGKDYRPGGPAACGHGHTAL